MIKILSAFWYFLRKILFLGTYIVCSHNGFRSNAEKMVPKLPTRQLGKDGPQVTALGWGAMNISCELYLDPKTDQDHSATVPLSDSSVLTGRSQLCCTAPSAPILNGSTTSTKSTNAAAGTGIARKATLIARSCSGSGSPRAEREKMCVPKSESKRDRRSTCWLTRNVVRCSWQPNLASE